MDLHCSFFFFSLLLIVEFQTASRSVVSFCGSSRTAATAAARQRSWHHAVWHCELHLLLSTCGWLMCCFIYFLSCLSLIHPQMSLPVLCKSDHHLSLILLFYLFFPQLLVPCADRQRLHVFTYHLHYNVDKVCWILNLYMALFLYRCQRGDNSTVEAERGPALLPQELLSIL